MGTAETIRANCSRAVASGATSMRFDYSRCARPVVNPASLTLLFMELSERFFVTGPVGNPRALSGSCRSSANRCDLLAERAVSACIHVV